MTTTEQSIVCIEPSCGKNFKLESGEIEFYIQRDFELPKRCRFCRSNRKNGSAPRQVNAPVAQSTDIVCSNCGKDSTVPFLPTPNSNVYCKICWIGVKNLLPA